MFKKKKSKSFEWRINEILKKRKKTPSLFLKNYHSFFFFFFKNNKILQRAKVFSRQSSPVITILRRTIVASIVEIAMPAAKRVAKFHLAKNTRRDRADRVIAPLHPSNHERCLHPCISIRIDEGEDRRSWESRVRQGIWQVNTAPPVQINQDDDVKPVFD